MIAFLHGRVLEKQPNRIIVDVGGVGYDVAVPLSTFYGVGDPGTEVSLRVHTHVREDALTLFGFLTPLELALFERLIAVSGIGPKLALAVLSGIEPRDLVAAVQRGDIARLTAIPGVGKKTAERLLLELRDKLDLPTVREGAPAGEASSDIGNALLALGYNEREVVWATRQLPPDVAVADGIRQALRLLSKP
jgi:holliday junction DNA helicase RuvA